MMVGWIIALHIECPTSTVVKYVGSDGMFVTNVAHAHRWRHKRDALDVVSSGRWNIRLRTAHVIREPKK